MLFAASCAASSTAFELRPASSAIDSEDGFVTTNLALLRNDPWQNMPTLAKMVKGNGVLRLLHGPKKRLSPDFSLAGSPPEWECFGHKLIQKTVRSELSRKFSKDQ
jgi:hypothetical protein